MAHDETWPAPEATPIAEPEITVKPGLRVGADDVIETKVKIAKVDRGTQGCPHGLPYIVVDGEYWHHRDGSAEFSFVECALELLPKKRGSAR